MNSSKNISEYYEALCASFFKQLKKSKKLDKEAIHDLRVDVKQIRAVAELSRHLCKNFPFKKTLKELKALYSSAGKQRTLIINQKLITKYDFEKEIIVELEKQRIKTSKKLKKEIKLFDSNRFKKICDKGIKALKSANEEKTNSQTLLQTKKILNDIKRGISRRDIPDSELHEIRKKLKMVKTNLHLLIDLNAADNMYKALYSKIKSAETAVGEWHDKAVLYEVTELLSGKLVLSRKTLSSLLKLKAINQKEKSEAIIQLRLLYK